MEKVTSERGNLHRLPNCISNSVGRVYWRSKKNPKEMAEKEYVRGIQTLDNMPVRGSNESN